MTLQTVSEQLMVMWQYQSQFNDKMEAIWNPVQMCPFNSIHQSYHNKQNTVGLINLHSVNDSTDKACTDNVTVED